MLNGQIINGKTFSNGNVPKIEDYNRYLISNFPFGQIARSFFFPSEVFKSGLACGLQEFRPEGNKFIDESGLAFDVGRYLIARYHGMALPYRYKTEMLNILKKVNKS